MKRFRDWATCAHERGGRRILCVALNIFMVGLAFAGLVDLAFGQPRLPVPAPVPATFPDPSFSLRDGYELAKNAGLFGTVLMFFMWQRSDSERRKLQGERDALLERVINANHTHSTTLQSIEKLLVIIENLLRALAGRQPTP